MIKWEQTALPLPSVSRDFHVSLASAKALCWDGTGGVQATSDAPSPKGTLLVFLWGFFFFKRIYKEESLNTFRSVQISVCWSKTFKSETDLVLKAFDFETQSAQLPAVRNKQTKKHSGEAQTRRSPLQAVLLACDGCMCGG